MSAALKYGVDSDPDGRTGEWIDCHRALLPSCSKEGSNAASQSTT